MAPITFGYATDIGKKRQYQEDAVYTFFAGGNAIHPDFGLFIVCDGIGGKGSGAKAAALAIQALALHIHQTLCVPLLEGEKVTITEALVEGIQQGNAAILQWADADAETKGAGTCLTAALLIDKTVYIAHVGDTRCYAVQPEKLDQLTVDHTFVEALIRAGHITREEAEQGSGGHTLYCTLGLPGIEIDTHIALLENEMCLLLCSDGVTLHPRANEIPSIIRASHSPQHACDRLIAEANERGGHDNSAVIIISNDFPFASGG